LGQFEQGIGVTPCQSAFRRFVRHIHPSRPCREIASGCYRLLF
jgi:hypothetical protein